MGRMHMGRVAAGLLFTSLLFVFGCTGGGESPLVFPPVPAEYADKHMPEGWWTDPKIVEEGKQIFEGKFDVDVNCASCHGRDGKPKKRGARDFRVAENMKHFSDSFWFWRISEGVPHTKMKAWKTKLSEEQRWKVMTYENTFAHGGQPFDHSKEYVPPPAAPAEAAE